MEYIYNGPEPKIHVRGHVFKPGIQRCLRDGTTAKDLAAIKAAGVSEVAKVAAPQPIVEEVVAEIKPSFIRKRKPRK